VTQQYYLRARYYNPVIARFTQEDIYRGDGLNLYAYCANNPVVYYDPSGYACEQKDVNRQDRHETPENTSNPNQPRKPEADVPKESSNAKVTNWKGEEVKIPDGHVMSPRDPDFSKSPKFIEGPFSSADREAFLKGKAGETKLAPHHRHQIPVRDGGVIDELPGPGHPSGNEHTAGSPSRHPGKSIFNAEEGGNKLRQNEIDSHWKAKGERLIEFEPGVWLDPGPQ
jgi:hypothetical protein